MDHVRVPLEVVVLLLCLVVINFLAAVCCFVLLLRLQFVNEKRISLIIDLQITCFLLKLDEQLGNSQEFIAIQSAFLITSGNPST